MKKAILVFFCMCSVMFAALKDHRMATWNLSGQTLQTQWNIGIRQLVTGENPIDILMLQGVSILPDTAMKTGRVMRFEKLEVFEYVWNLGVATPKANFIYHARIDMGGRNMYLAIVSTQRADEVIILTPSVPKPMIGIRVGDNAFFSIHAFHDGDDVASIQAVTEYFMEQPQIHWMIAGMFQKDWQKLMENLNDSGDIYVVAPADENALDYGIASKIHTPNISATRWLGKIKHDGVSNYLPVYFKIF